MSIPEKKIDCPLCGSSLEVPVEAIGRRLQCWSCEKKFELTEALYYGQAKVVVDEPSLVEQLLCDESEEPQKSAPKITSEGSSQKKRKKISKRKKSSDLPRRSRKQQKKNSVTKIIMCLSFLGLLTGGYFLYEKGFLSESSQSNKLMAEDHSGIKMNFDNNSLKELAKNCLPCHGQVEDGKRIIKGSFDLVPLLQSGVTPIHTKEWLQVLDQIESNEMPPEEKKPLESATKNEIMASISSVLNQKKLSSRLLTSHELLNSTADILGFDKRSFDPFEGLHFIRNPDARFPTINSSFLMSDLYIKELGNGLDLALNNYTRKAKSRAKKEDKNFHIYFDEPVNGQLRYLDTKAEIASMNNKDKKAYNTGVIKAKINKPRLDFISRGRIRMKATDSIQYSVNFLPGKYRISFKAKTLNRNFVKKTYSDSTQHAKNTNTPKFSDAWGRDLIEEKACLSLYHEGQHVNQWDPNKSGGYVTGSKPGVLIQRFFIEDDIEKNYSCDFTLKEPARISLSFENGPLVPRRHWIRLGKYSMAKDAGNTDHPFPRIELSERVKLEKIGPAPINSDYSLIGEGAPLNELDYIQKAYQFSNELSLPFTKNQVGLMFKGQPSMMSEDQKFLKTLAMLMMSPQNVYLDYHSDVEGSKERFAAYSLLKTHPDQEFKKNYLHFRQGGISAEKFAEYLINKPAFENFLEQFCKHWLEHDPELDVKKFNGRIRSLPFMEETQNYLKYILKGNRPLKELYTSELRVIDRSLALFYKLDDSTLGKLERGRFAPVVMPRGKKGGILAQGKFFTSQSDGVDPQHFKRANWICENIFDKSLPSPPAVDSAVFSSNLKDLSFEQLALVHAQSKACNSCHRVLDPVASAFKHLGTLGEPMFIKSYDGVNHHSIDQFQGKVQKSEEKIARAFTKHLLAFITGRENNFYDLNMIDKILDQTSKNHYRSGDILASIIDIYLKD